MGRADEAAATVLVDDAETNPARMTTLAMRESGILLMAFNLTLSHRR
jgi:hypothetical protein